jgi:hypothetical protein
VIALVNGLAHRGASLATERQVDDASLEVTVIVCGFDHLELLAAVL